MKAKKHFSKDSELVFVPANSYSALICCDITSLKQRFVSDFNEKLLLLILLFILYRILTVVQKTLVRYFQSCNGKPQIIFFKIS